MNDNPIRKNRREVEQLRAEDEMCGGLHFGPPTSVWCNPTRDDITLIASGREIFCINTQGDIVSDGKVITHDHAAILECLRRWAAAHGESVDE